MLFCCAQTLHWLAGWLVGGRVGRGTVARGFTCLFTIRPFHEATATSSLLLDVS